MSNDTDEFKQDGGNKGTWIAVAAIVVIVAAGLVWWLTSGDDTTQQRQPVERSMEVPKQPETAAQPEPEPEPQAEPDDFEPVAETPSEQPQQPEPEQPLPSLAQSTPVVMETLAQDEVDTQPLSSDSMIRDVVVFVDNLRNGMVVTEHAPVARPDGQFAVIELDDKLYIDERSYDRYDNLVSWFTGIDNQVLIKNYRHFQPLISEAYGEIGYPDGDFTDSAIEAIDVLLATPEPDSLIEVEDDQVMYTYADPALEGLPPAQKQLLRVGPENMRKIKAKLREIKQQLKQM